MTRSQGWLVTCLLVGLLVATVAPPCSSRWEYLAVVSSDATFEVEADALGDMNWELVAARRAGAGEHVVYECLFKRRQTNKGILNALAVSRVANREAGAKGK